MTDVALPGPAYQILEIGDRIIKVIIPVGVATSHVTFGVTSCRVTSGGVATGPITSRDGIAIVVCDLEFVTTS